MICSECIAASICMVGRGGSQCNEFLKRVEALKPSHNSDYAAALRASSSFRDSGIDVTLEHFEQWCFERLNSAKPNCA